MREVDFISIFIEEKLMTGAGGEQPLFFTCRVWSLIFCPPAAAPNRRRRIARLEFDPDAVAHLGQENETVLRASEGRAGIAQPLSNSPSTAGTVALIRASFSGSEISVTKPRYFP